MSRKPAARLTDMHICPKVNPGGVPHVGGPVIIGSPDVFINFLPAARVGDNLVCVGPPDKIKKGSSSVFVNGKALAYLGSSTSHKGKIIIGSMNVEVGV